jgi:hypothetical protein
LVFGRREEFAANGALSKQRAGLKPDWLEWMTYDRLKPLAGARNSVTAHVTNKGWEVLAVPPTFRLGPRAARTLVQLSGWEQAISDNTLLSRERREFLLSRLDYWRDWVKNDGASSRAGDSE